MAAERRRPRAWSTPADITRAARRAWDSGAIARSSLTGEFAAVEVPLYGPRPSEIGADLGAVRAWVSALETGSRGGSHYDLTWSTVGGRAIGRNRIPVRATVGSVSQAAALLGVHEAVQRLIEIAALASDLAGVRDWVHARPLQAIEMYDVFPALVAAYAWLDAHRGSGRYLREISAPGVDTKFAERHRAVLAAMLGVSSTAAGFVTELGLASKPSLVRLRMSPGLGFPAGIAEVACRVEDLAGLAVSPNEVFIIENEITYLSAPVPEGGLVVWGSGFAVDLPGRLPWMVPVAVTYWGDLDTHGFAILDRLRAHLPRARSVLMDTETLMEHRDRWVIEERPTAAALTRLTPAEYEVYSGLVEDRWGPSVRLEQERIDWTWVGHRLGASALRGR
jgi:hypothetical protein